MVRLKTQLILVDLDAFSENNYIKEIQDFEAILELVDKKFNNDVTINVIGHSRGGRDSSLTIGPG